MAGEIRNKLARMKGPESMAIPTIVGAEEDPRERGGHESVGHSFAEEAMSNHLILQNVFNFLDNSDINACCQVNEYWNSIADPLLVTYYDIKIDTSPADECDEDDNDIYLYNAAITKMASYKSSEAYYSRCNHTVDDATELLETAMGSEKFSINLVTDAYKRDETVVDFINKFGSFVEKLTPTFTLKTKTFFRVLAHNFPNVKHLDLTVTRFAQRDLFNDANVAEHQMRYLKRIDLGKDYEHIQLINILGATPNLEEIHNFPLLMVDALLETKTGGCVKSLMYPWISEEGDDKFEVAFDKLANLEPRLHTFSFVRQKSSWAAEPFRESLYPSVKKILQSSQVSLSKLILYQCVSFDFKPVPPMRSLEEITFSVKNPVENRLDKCISVDVVLRDLFPNASVVDIPDLLCLYPLEDEDITMCFPGIQFNVWGSQIATLKLGDVSVNLLEQLSGTFSSVKSLEFHIGRNGDDIRLLLPASGKYWPELEFLTVIVDYCHYNRSICDPVYDRRHTLDSVLTGIPDESVTKLKDPICRKNDFTPQEIEAFKEASTLRKLSKLKMLTFDVRTMFTDRFMEKLSDISPVSSEFGLDFVPKLQIVVRIDREDPYKTQISEMKTSLERFNNFTIQRI